MLPGSTILPGSELGTTSTTPSVPSLSLTTSDKPHRHCLDQRLLTLLLKPFPDGSTALFLFNKAATWQTDTTLFWEHFKLSGSSFEDPIPQLVVNCLLVPSDSSHGIICRRFHCVALLKKTCTKRAVRAVAKVIHAANILPGRSIKDLRKNMGELLRAGERYSLLVKRFGIGCLVVLGQHTARSTWERYLPTEGQVCDDFLCELETKGLREKARPWTNFGDELLQQIIETYPYVQSSNDEMKPISKLNRKRSYFEAELSSKIPWPTEKPLTIALNTPMGVPCYPRLYPHSQQISGEGIPLSLAASPYMAEAFTEDNYAPAQIRGTNSSLILDDLHQRAQATSQGVFPSRHDVHVVAPEKGRILTDAVGHSPPSKTSEDTGGPTLLTIDSITINSDTGQSTHSPINNLSAVDGFVDNSTGTVLATYGYQPTHMVVPQTLEPLMESWGSADNFTASSIVRPPESHNLFPVSEVMPQTHQPLMTTWGAADDFAASSIVQPPESYNLFPVNEVVPQTHQPLLTTWGAAEDIPAHRNSYDSVLQTSSL